MTRLARLMKVVAEEQAVAFTKPSLENVDSLKRCQDRLLKYCTNSGRTAPYELFFVPGVK